MRTLRERAQWLVKQYWGGSVNAAAGHLGISQQTLNRIVLGTTTNPSRKVLTQIIERGPAGMTLDWLALGKGEPPPTTRETGTPTAAPITAPLLRWWLLVESLELPMFTAEAMNMLPYAVMQLSTLGGVFEEGEEPAAHTFDAVDKAAEAWSLVLEAGIKHNGRARVAEALRTNGLPLASLGFTVFTMMLRADPSRPFSMQTLPDVYRELMHSVAAVAKAAAPQTERASGNAHPKAPIAGKTKKGRL